MDEPKSPEDILDEIMNRRPGSSPSPTSYPPEFEPPPPEDIPLPPLKIPGNAAKPDWAAKLLPWLCLMLGCALLVLGVCVLQVAKVNDRLDALEQAVESVQAVDSLQKENKQLQQALEAAQNEAEAAKEVQEQLESILTTYEGNYIQIRLLSYLFYIEQFIDNGDAPMAALIVGLSADPYFSLLYDSYYDYDIPGNFETYLGRYLSYKRTLIEEGYLEEQSENHEPFSPLTFAQQWDPEQNSDMAALGLLWCVMDEYYARNDSHTAVQFLVEYQDYPLRGTEDSCLAHLSRIASNYTSIQYELVIGHMKHQGCLVEQNGRYDYGTFEGGWADVLYSLPFDPPAPDPNEIPLN